MIISLSKYFHNHNISLSLYLQIPRYRIILVISLFDSTCMLFSSYHIGFVFKHFHIHIYGSRNYFLISIFGKYFCHFPFLNISCKWNNAQESFLNLLHFVHEGAPPQKKSHLGSGDKVWLCSFDLNQIISDTVQILRNLSMANSNK